MKKLIVVIGIVLTLITPVHAKSAGISSQSKTIFIGSSFTLSLKNTKKKVSIAYAKGYASVRRLSKTSFRVTGKKAGKTTISLKLKKKTYKCRLTINEFVYFKAVGVRKTFTNKKVKFVKGDTAYTLLQKSNLSIKKTGFGKFVYVTTINGLREKQYGPASGWTYRVNGKLPNVSSAVYKLKAKDHLEWRYVNYN
jgi:hypothetical protein